MSATPAVQTSAEVPVLGPGEILKAKQVASWLNCHVSTVYVLFDKGLLKGFSLMGPVAKGKRGRKGLRFLASGVSDYITSSLAVQDVDVPPTVEVEQEATVPPATTPARGRPGSRVTLPCPGRSR